MARVKFCYVSPSVIPSRSANSIHVLMQCQALADQGATVTLYAQRLIKEEGLLRDALLDSYGFDCAAIELVTYHAASARMSSLRIAIEVLRRRADVMAADVVLSRNLYASWLIAYVFGRPLLFETHQLESGFRKRIQSWLLRQPRVVTVAISQQLVMCLEAHHGHPVSRPLVLHDAAPAGSYPVPQPDRRAVLASLFPSIKTDVPAVCGYFGHLYPGRGLEVICALAAARPQLLFLVVGGNEAEITAYRAHTGLPNLVFAGHVPHHVARRAMAACDLLLMPYQKSVSIGVSGHDTARWMSPMKMFEYMASGVPLVSSDLPVLSEVLEHGRNALLATADAPEEWLERIDWLVANPAEAALIAGNAYRDYVRNHTWQARADSLMQAGHGLAG
jgi:glycosyltransferase involved in cell wall biosynthesis